MPDDTQSVLPRGVTEYGRFERLGEVDYDRVNRFLRRHVQFTAREWAIARLCTDFQTKTGVEMTTIGDHLPGLVPFMEEPYTRQAVYQARKSFMDRLRRAGATFLYGAYAGFLTAEELDDVMYESTEVAKFLLEIEGTPLAHADEIGTETRIMEAMRAVHEASLDLRYDRCPYCGEELNTDPS